MHDPAENQPPLDRAGIALRYLFAMLPMLFYGVVLVVAAPGDRGDAFAPVDVGLGVVGLVLMGWRRHRPWPIALATALLTAFSSTAAGPAYVAYVSLCTHRRWHQVISGAIVFGLCQAAFPLWHNPGRTAIFPVASGTVFFGGLTVFGLYVRSRRDLDASRRAAALTVVEQAKLAERVKIAHEMHDVLAHRISLLSMLAGGLAYRTDLTAEETREVALAIQENAHQSLNELRTVLGALRRDGAPEAPQPTLAHVDALFDEVRAAGQRVEVDDTIDDRELLPAQTGRHAYRIVQEALTNARKHAPGSRVTAELGGRPGDGLRIRVSNPVPFGRSSGPGGRLGLVGLAERTRVIGGTISHAVQDGYFILDVRLPWEA